MVEKDASTIFVVKKSHILLLLVATVFLIAGYALGNTTKECGPGYEQGANDALLTILSTVQQNGYVTINAGDTVVNLAPVRLESGMAIDTSTSLPAKNEEEN